ncbi:FecR family protein [Sphingobacterium chungjuense]|uniref:FecR family protein n=1 Tax=Sphingobacterium chungjuense TaxID=2675553 RepID=UPI0014095068|nr:FecR domain-containing protein [Sphingobacterium chungjuense]
MLRDEFDNLLNKYLDGSCTDEERQLINLWLIKRGADEHIKVAITDEKVLKDRLLAGIDKLDREQLLHNDMSKGAIPKTFIPLLKKYLLPIAALFLLAIFSIIWYAQQNQMKQQDLANLNAIPAVENTLTPTSFKINVAGKDYLIDSLPTNEELIIGKTILIKHANNTLQYKLADETGINSKILHTISVPAGRDLHLLLSDGSKIWLNTESVLRFPAQFAADERHLYLLGEGFFEVASNTAHPFIVNSQDFHVRATGTEFHIRAYPDDTKKTTTLVEGKVDVSTNKQNQKLKPNQQWAWQKAGSATVKDVDVSDILANKDGYFVFQQKDIMEIMHEVSRWYGIDVQFDGKISQTKFGGTFSKKRTIDELIDYLSVLGGFHIKRQGREVIIMP